MKKETEALHTALPEKLRWEWEYNREIWAFLEKGTPRIRPVCRSWLDVPSKFIGLVLIAYGGNHREQLACP